MRSWTHYWTNRTASNAEFGYPMDHTASDNFRRLGVEPGDQVYVISFGQGVLTVLGRMQVGKIVGQAEAERILKYDLWDADDHLLAKPRTATTIGRHVVPDSILNTLEFIAVDGEVLRVKYNKVGNVEPQSFRTEVREITLGTARAFDRVLRA